MGLGCVMEVWLGGGFCPTPSAIEGSGLSVEATSGIASGGDVLGKLEGESVEDGAIG